MEKDFCGKNKLRALVWYYSTSMTNIISRTDIYECLYKATNRLDKDCVDDIIDNYCHSNFSFIDEIHDACDFNWWTDKEKSEILSQHFKEERDKQKLQENKIKADIEEVMFNEWFSKYYDYNPTILNLDNRDEDDIKYVLNEVKNMSKADAYNVIKSKFDKYNDLYEDSFYNSYLPDKFSLSDMRYLRRMFVLFYTDLEPYHRLISVNFKTAKGQKTELNKAPEQPDGQIILPSNLDTPKAREMFPKAIEAGLMEITATGFKWLYSLRKYGGGNALAAYFFGKVFCGDKLCLDIRRECVVKLNRSSFFPESKLCELFDMKYLSNSRLQLNEKTPPKGYERIDILFST